MLALLRPFVVLLALALPALAEEPANNSEFSQKGFFFGVGYAPEYFHWHETITDQWLVVVNNGRQINTVTVGYGPSHRFVTEDGWRHRFSVTGGYRFDQTFSVQGRATYLRAAVYYDGGLQSDSLVLVTPAQYYEDAYGNVYPVYKTRSVAYTAVTGYSGWEFDATARGEIPLRSPLFLDASLGWSHRPVKRMIDYDGTSSSRHGYDETWTLDWTELGIGPELRHRTWKASLRGVCLFPIASTEDINEGTRQFTLSPAANNGWRAELNVEWSFGLRLGLSYEQRDFSESPSITIDSFVYSQPTSVERVGRLDVSWFF